MKKDKIATVARHLRTLRAVARISPEELAVKVEMPVDWISDSENEDVGVPLEVAKLILKQYNIDPNDWDLDSDRHYVDPTDKLKGGKKNKRDRRFGIDDDDYWDWWHREGKPANGGRDIETSDEAEEWYKYWISQGCPVPKEIAAALIGE